LLSSENVQIAVEVAIHTAAYLAMSVCLSVCLHVRMSDAFLRVCRLAGRATAMIQALKKKVTERKDITVTRLPIQLHTN